MTALGAATEIRHSAQNNSLYDTVRFYMQQAGKFPLLKPEMETELGQKVQLWQLQILLKQWDEGDRSPKMAKAIKKLEPYRERLTGLDPKRVEREGMRARDRFVEHNLRLVIKVAQKYKNLNIAPEDLFQHGAMGLQRAAEKYDPLTGFRFSTYAYWWIRQAMTRAIGQESRTIRVPIHINEKWVKVKRIVRDFYREHNRTPSIEEITDIYNSSGLKYTVTPDVVKKVFEIHRSPLSLDQVRAYDESDASLSAVIPSDVDVLDEVATRDRRELIFQSLRETLTPRQFQVLVLRNGLDGGGVRSLQDIGKDLGLSRERVRQIQREAMSRLKRDSTMRQLALVL